MKKPPCSSYIIIVIILCQIKKYNSKDFQTNFWNQTKFPHRENNCQELKKETEDKIQTLGADHKVKVTQNF